MKKIFKQLFIVISVIELACGPICRHKHTEECGEDGIDCTHKCHEEIDKSEIGKGNDPRV